MALGWTLLYARTVALGAVIVAPLAAGALEGLLAPPVDRAAARLERWLVPASVVVAITLAAFLAPSVAARPGGVPLALDAAIDRLPEGTVVLNDDALGGWLLLEHPGVSPVIDTRTYLFDIPYIEDYIRTRGARGRLAGLRRAHRRDGRDRARRRGARDRAAGGAGMAGGAAGGRLHAARGPGGLSPPRVTRPRGRARGRRG